MTDPRSAAQTAIAQAGFSAATERNAMRLLARASDENGHILTDWATLCDLFGCSQAVVRRHLGYIAATGIIHYSTNMWVYINFLAWQPSTQSTKIVHSVDEKRAWARDEETEPAEIVHSVDENQTPDAETPDADRPLSVRKTRVGARKTYTEWTIGGDNRGGMNERDHSSPLPGEIFIQSIPEAEQKMTVAILTDPAIRLGAWKARQIAQIHPFATVRAYCCDFIEQGKRPLDDAGLIDWWLKNEPVPPVVVNELYRCHRTPDEIAADEAQRLADDQRYEQAVAEISQIGTSSDHLPAVDTQFDTPAPVKIRRVEPVEIWKAALSDLASTLPAQTFETWVRDTNVLSCADGEFVIGVPHAQARDWLHNRLRPQIRRTLGRLTQRSTDVSFAVRPRNGD